MAGSSYSGRAPVKGQRIAANRDKDKASTVTRSGKTKQPARVFTADLGSVDLANLTIVEPARGVFEGFERIIDGIQNTVAAHLQHCRKERGRPEVSTGRHIHILTQILPEG